MTETACLQWLQIGMRQDYLALITTTPQTTYEAATTHIIGTRVNLDLISLGLRSTRAKGRGLSSWVPDLRLEFAPSNATSSRNSSSPGDNHAADGRQFSPYDTRIALNTRYLRDMTYEDGPMFLDYRKALVTPGVWVDRTKDVGRTYFININGIDEAHREHRREILAESTRMAQTCTAGSRQPGL